MTTLKKKNEEEHIYVKNYSLVFSRFIFPSNQNDTFFINLLHNLMYNAVESQFLSPKIKELSF